MQTVSTNSKKKGWKKVGQQIKLFFQSNPIGNIQGEEIDYYHQYVYPKKLESMKQSKKNLMQSRTTSRREQ